MLTEAEIAQALLSQAASGNGSDFTGNIVVPGNGAPVSQDLGMKTNLGINSQNGAFGKMGIQLPSITNPDEAMAALNESQKQYNAYLDTAQNTFGERTNMTDDDKRRLEMAGMHLYGSGVYGNGLEDWKTYGEQQEAEIKGRNDQIRRYLNANMDKLNPDAVKEIMEQLDAMDKGSGEVWRSVYDNEDMQAWDKARIADKEQQEAAEKKAAAQTNLDAARKRLEDARLEYTGILNGEIVSPKTLAEAQEEIGAAKQAYDDAETAFKDAGGELPSFLQRVLFTGKGAVKGSLASVTDAERALYEAGQSGRSRAMQEEIAYEQRMVEQSQRDLDKVLALHNGDTENGDVEAARNLLEEHQRKLAAYQQVEGAQTGAAAAAAELADDIQQSSARDLERAKANASTFGKFAVDVGSSGIQMLLDSAAGAATGVGMLPAMALRSFGGGTQEARQAGASLRQQLGYGAATAAVEVVTEKLADGLAGLAGKGAADDMAEEIIRRLASSDEGRTALRAIYGMGGEGFEEVISSLVNPAIKRIYNNGDALKESYGTAEGRKQLLIDTAYDALVGAALGGTGTVASLATGQNADANRDLTIKDAGITAEGQFQNAMNVAEGRMTLDEQLAREQAARQRLGISDQAPVRNPVLDLISGNQQAAAPAAPAQTSGNPVLDVLQTGEVQPAQAAPTAATPTAEATQPAPEAPASQPVPEKQTTASRLTESFGLSNEESTQLEQILDGYDENQARLDELGDLLRTMENDDPRADALADEANALFDKIREQNAKANALIETHETQQTRIANGEVSKAFGTEENHIDRRTASEVGKTNVKAFQFDHPQLHEYFAKMAEVLYNMAFDADETQKNTKSRKKTSKYYQNVRQSYSQEVQTLMAWGLTKPQIMKACQDIMNNNGVENYAAAKRVELILDQMLSDGYKSRSVEDGAAGWSSVPSNPEYIAAKQAIAGSEKIAADDSFERFLEKNDLSLALGLTTEEELRTEWEAQHPAETAEESAQTDVGEQTESQTVNAADSPSAPPPGGGGPTLTPTDTTTAESTNGTGNERERGGSANIRTNENAEADLRQSFENAPEMYRQMTNAEVQQKADAIMAKGFAAARSEVEQGIGQAKAGMKLKPEHLVAGFEVANEMTRRGEVDAANRLMADLFAEQTAGGQLGQLGRLLRAQAPATKSMTIENIVEKMNNALVKEQTRKNIRRGVGDAEGRISVDSALVEQFANATDDASSDAALEAIQRDIARQIPATIAEKFAALRYLNMLGNLKTQGRNIVGNTAMMLATDVKRTVQAVNELAAAALSGGKYERNTSLFTSRDLRQQAAADFDANIDEIRGERKYSDASRKALQGIQDYRTIFGSGENAFTLNIGGRDVEVKKNVLENARRLTNWAMEAGDDIFMRHTYIQAFAGWMKAHGVSDTSTATQEQIQKARAFAAKEAQEATFHDNNVVSDWVSGLGRGQNTPGFVRALSEGIMPFRKTPANVAVRAIEYSPIGIAETIYTGVQAAKGKASMADVINSASKTVTGSALAVAGYFLAAAGKARGSGNDEDKELNNFQKMQGAADYSIKIGDSYVSLSQFAPMAIPFFMGVKLQELIENSDEPLSLDSVGDILGIISDPMLEMSMLSGVNDTLSNVASLSGDTDAIPSLVANAALGYLSQGLTNSLLGQAEQASEENRQTTYTDTKSEDATVLDQMLGKGQYKLGQYAAKIPGIDYNQQDYVDAWGRTQSNGDTWERLFNAFINPTYATDDRSTEVDAELERLHNDNRDVEGFPEVLPQKRARSATIGDGIIMTPDEYLQFSKDSGQMKLSLVKDFIGSEQYQGLSDGQRAQIISDLYSLADDLSMRNIKTGYGVDTKSKWDKAASMKDPVEYLTAAEIINQTGSSFTGTPDYSQVDSVLANFGRLNQDTQNALTSLANVNNMRFALDELGIGSGEYFNIKNLVADEQKSNLGGKSGGAADAIVLAKEGGRTDAEKLAALEAINQPDKQDGKRAAIVRRFEAAVQEYEIPFDKWAVFEAYIQDHAKSAGSPSNSVIYDAEDAAGISRGAGKDIWRKLAGNEEKIDVYDDYFSRNYVEPEKVSFGNYLSGAASAGSGSGYLTESEIARILGITG